MDFGQLFITWRSFLPNENIYFIHTIDIFAILKFCIIIQTFKYSPPMCNNTDFLACSATSPCSDTNMLTVQGVKRFTTIEPKLIISKLSC